MLACAVPSGRRLVAAILFALIAAPASAQDHLIGDEAYALASPPSNPTDHPTPPPADAPPPDDSTVLSRALTFDPFSLSTAPVKPLRLPRLGDTHALAVSRASSEPDGSGTVTVKQPLPTDWNANVGADLGLASNTSPMSSDPIGRPLPAPGESSSGAAWASLGVANLATLNARVDPTNDQGRIGTTLQRSIPFGSRLSVTLQGSYSFTDNFSAPGATAPNDIPVMAMPQASAGASQVWDNQGGVKLGILPTGTTLGASMASSSVDPVTHNTLSAEQQLLGPLHVTTAVTDVGQPTESKSISAGLKFNW